MNASAACPHPAYDANVEVFDFGDTTLKVVELSVRCVGCGRSLLFNGPIGVQWTLPTVNADRTTLHAPALTEGDEMPANLPPSYGIDLGREG